MQGPDGDDTPHTEEKPVKYWSPGDPGHCHHITHHADAYGPEEYCENDTAPDAMYCPAHEGEDQ